MSTLLDELRAALSDTRLPEEHKSLHWKALREITRLQGELRLRLADEQQRLIWEARLQAALDRTEARGGAHGYHS